MSSMRKIKAALLVEDLSLYPRHQVDEQHARSLAVKLQAGEKFPPVTVEKGTLRIIDGFHRTRATLRVFGADAEIAVVEVEYASDAEAFVAAMRLNSKHGQPLSPYDLARCAVQAMQLGISDEDVAKALAITPIKLEDIKKRKTTTGPDEQLEPIKEVARHLAQETASEKQLAAIKRANGGLSPIRVVNELLTIIQGDLIDWNNQALVGRLQELRSALDVAFTQRQEAA